MAKSYSKIVVLVAAAATLLGLLVAGPGTPAASAAVPTAPASARANDRGCEPDADHPVPVVIVHGTFGDQYAWFDNLKAYLLRDGYCVFALDYGYYGTDPVAESAGELKTFVNKVLGWTGASKVSIVGHSQGGALARYYVKYLGGIGRVDDLIGLAPANHGTTWKKLLTLIPNFTCGACKDLMAGSSFLATLNLWDESPGRVSYTNVVSKYDTVLRPYTSAFLDGGANVSNILIQDSCPEDKVNHVYLPLDAAAVRIVGNALAHPGPADPDYRPKCSW